MVVLDKLGKKLSQTEIRSEEKGVLVHHMRFLENIEWISKDKVVVSGSLNPSTIEYLVIDINRQKIVDDLIGDGPMARFSPDGSKYWDIY